MKPIEISLFLSILVSTVSQYHTLSAVQLHNVGIRCFVLIPHQENFKRIIYDIHFGCPFIVLSWEMPYPRYASLLNFADPYYT